MKNSVIMIGSTEKKPLLQKAAVDTVGMLLLPLRLYLTKLVMDNIQLWGQGEVNGALIVSCVLLASLMTSSAFLTSASLLMHTRIYELGVLLKERAIVEKSARLPLRSSESPEVQDLRNRAQLYSPDFVCLEGMSFLLNSLQSVLIFGLICRMGYWPLALGLIAFGGFQSWLYVKIGARLERSKRKQTSAFRLADHIHELLLSRSTAKELRIFELGPMLQQRWFAFYRDAGKQNQRALAHSEGMRVIPENSFALMSGIAILAIVLSDTAASSSAGDFVLLFQCVTMLAGAIPNAVRQLGALTQMAVHGEDFAAFRELEEDRYVEGPTGKEAAGKLGVTVEEASFRYENGAQAQPVLEKLNFKIEPGSKVAIVGENGSGKSTLVKLLLGLYQPDEGSIGLRTGNGRVDARDPCCRTSVVFQDFTRYHLTLRENVAIGDVNQVEDTSAIRRCLEKAGIGSISTLVDEMLGTEFGSFDLSGGQWQKVALARAYLRGEGFLILDEPTAALDPKAEKQAFAEFLKAAEGQTAVLVTHRLGAAKQADYIFVLKNGKLVEQGTHEDLIEQKGEYARLYRIQSAWYR